MDADVMTLLATFRRLDTSNDGIPVLGDEQAMRVLVAWSRTDQDWHRPREPMPEVSHGKHAAAWAWVCSGWKIDVEKVARLAGVSVRNARAKLDMLVGLRLVYPDGVMAKGAETALNVHVSQKLGVKQRSPGAQPAGKKPDKPSGSENSNN